jgi:DNA-binding response OmpR family regulator
LSVLRTVLQVEDESNDVALFALALQRARANVILRAVSDGSLARDYLEGIGVYADRSQWPFPDLILLDLKLPGFDGIDFLSWRRATSFSEVPLIVLTGARDKKLLERALALGGLMAITKPCAFKDLVTIAGEICALVPEPDGNSAPHARDFEHELVLSALELSETNP